jgi:MFS family permease
MAPTGRSASGSEDDNELFTAAFLALSAAELAYFTAFGLLIPVVPVFATDSLGAGTTGVGVAVGAFSVMALLLRPLAGRLADRHGRRPVLVAGGLLFALVTAAHLLAGNLIELVALRLLLGAAEALFFVAATAALADLAPPRRLGEALSYNSLSLYLGIAWGPALGESLLDVGGFSLAWLGGAGLAVIATLLAMRVGETGSPRTGGTKLPLIHTGVLLPGLAFFSGLAGSAGFLAFIALQARHVGLTGAATVLAVYGLVVIGCRIVFAKLSDRVPALPLGAVALALCAAGLAVMGFVANGPGLVTGAVVLAIGVAFLTPAFYRTIMSRVQPHERGSAAGTFSIFVDLGLGGGPMLLGLVAASSGITAAFTAGAFLAVVGAIGTALLTHPHQRPLKIQ